MLKAARALSDGPHGTWSDTGTPRANCRTMQARPLPSTSPSLGSSSMTCITSWPRFSNWLPSPISAWMRACTSAQPAPVGIVVVVVEVTTVVLVVLDGDVVLVSDVLVVLVVVLVEPSTEVDVVLEVLVDVVLEILVVDDEVLVVVEVDVVLVSEVLV